MPISGVQKDDHVVQSIYDIVQSLFSKVMFGVFRISFVLQSSVNKLQFDITDLIFNYCRRVMSASSESSESGGQGDGSRKKTYNIKLCPTKKFKRYVPT